MLLRHSHHLLRHRTRATAGPISGAPMENSPRTESSWFSQGKSAFSSDKFPQSGPLLRDALRVLSIVQSLHESGYQWIRAFTCLSSSGVHWRCYVTSADNVEDNGWTLKCTFTNVADYTSGDGAAPFGWDDAEKWTYPELALRFAKQFPALAECGAGSDQAYADWFAGMMITARTGRLPIFSADYAIDLSAVSVPPPPRDSR